MRLADKILNAEKIIKLKLESFHLCMYVRKDETTLETLNAQTQSREHLMRLPNVFKYHLEQASVNFFGYTNQ